MKIHSQPFHTITTRETRQSHLRVQIILYLATCFICWWFPLPRGGAGTLIGSTPIDTNI